MRTLEFQLGELFVNLRRNGFLTFAAVMTVTASLTIFGLFHLINLNLQNLIEQEARKGQISVFLQPNLDAPALAQVREAIMAIPGVRDAEYVSPEQALARLKKSLNLRDDLLKESRLPAKFAVLPTEPQQIQAIAEQLRRIEGVKNVDDAGDIVTRLNQLVKQIHNFGIAALVILGLATSAIISNAIRLTIYARRREIRIMQLVGATDGFIRIPFLLEGLVHGLLGGALAVSVTALLYDRMADANAVLTPWLRLTPFPDLMPQFGVAILLLGILLGGGSSLLSMRQFLREA